MDMGVSRKSIRGGGPENVVFFLVNSVLHRVL